MKIKNTTINNWILGLIVFIPVQFIFFNIVTRNHNWVENVFSQNIYKGIVFALRSLFGWINIPVAQIVILGLIIVAIVFIIRQIVLIKQGKLHFRGFLWKVVINGAAVFSVFYFLFMTLWGLNYHRQAVSEIVEVNTSNITTAELEAVCLKLIQLTNQSRKQLTNNEQHSVVVPLMSRQIIERSMLGYARVAKVFPQFEYKKLSVKSVYFPKLMSMVGVGGIYIPFTGEAIVNMDPPSFALPATVCHEMAHQLGFSPEDEANYISFLACTSNPDPSFRYSGYLMAMRHAMYTLAGLNHEAYARLQQNIGKGVMVDINADKAYWRSFYNPLTTFTSFFYDYFLKANGQHHGIKSYSLMVKLIVGEYRKNGLSMNFHKSYNEQ